MVSKSSRLSRSSEFQRVYRQGSSTASRFLVLYYFRRPAGASAAVPRLGLSVSRKLGGAVERNRIKRLLREAFTACQDRLVEDHDVVFIARSQLTGLIERQERGEKGIVAAEVLALLERAKLLRPTAGGPNE